MKYHDLNIKTDFSYGTLSPQEVVNKMREIGVGVLALADLFKIEQINSIKIPDGMRVFSGSEWFTKCDFEGVERVDLIFLDFEVTEHLKVWVKREMKRMDFKKRAMPAYVDYDDHWRCKEEFGEMIKDEKLRRTYFGTLPLTDLVLKKFTNSGAKFILSDIPFAKDFATKCKIIKRLKDLGLMGVIVFRNEDAYIDTEKEIQEMLDLCRYADIVPIVGSGCYKDYEKRNIAMEMAEGAFTFLTKSLLETIDCK